MEPKRGPGRPPLPKYPDGYSEIARGARKIARDDDAKDSDKLTALRLLSEIQQLGGETGGPPPPDDEAGETEALCMILSAARPAAIQSAFASLGWGAILIPEEARGEEVVNSAATGGTAEDSPL